MKSIFSLVILILFPIFSSAQEMGMVLGMRNDSADSTVSGVTIESKSNFQIGGVALFELKEAFRGRSGFIYTNRNYEYKTTATKDEVKLSYFDIPFGVQYKMSDYGGPFAGVVAAMNVSKSCPGGSCSGVSGSPIGFQVGASFKFAPQMGGEFYYESFSGKMLDGVESAKAVALNFMLTFD